MENKKLIPILGLGAVVLVIATLLIFFAVRHKKKNQVFLDSDRWKEDQKTEMGNGNRRFKYS